MSISAAHTTLHLFLLWETDCVMISINNKRMYYEMQLPIGKSWYTVFHIMSYVGVHMMID